MAIAFFITFVLRIGLKKSPILVSAVFYSHTPLCFYSAYKDITKFWNIQKLLNTRRVNLFNKAYENVTLSGIANETSANVQVFQKLVICLSFVLSQNGSCRLTKDYGCTTYRKLKINSINALIFRMLL